MHFSGIIVHGLMEVVYLSDANMRKDPNTQIELMSEMLGRVQNYCAEHDRPWPDHISAQADNCFREARNQYTMCFGILLVLLGNVTTFTYHFLSKGHTHEDIGYACTCVALLCMRVNARMHP